MTRAKMILAALGVILVIVIVAQNTESVQTRFLFVSVAMPRAVLLGLTFSIGVVVGLLLAFGISSKKKKAAE